MKRKLCVFSGMLTLAVICTALTTDAFQATTKNPDLHNKYKGGKKKNFWVHRRNTGDDDASGAFAVAIHITGKQLGGPGEVVATITRYTDYVPGQKLYTTRSSIGAIGTIAGNSTEDSRERETLILRTQDGDDEVGYLTFYKGKAKGKGSGNRKHTRAIFRWNAEFAASLKSPDAKSADDSEKSGDCDAPPDDDPMEEEDLTYEDPEGVPIPASDLDDPLDP